MGGVTKFTVKFHEAMYQLVTRLAERLETPVAEVIREALSLYGWAANEHEQGNKLLVQRGDDITEIVIPSLQQLRPEVGRRQETVGSPRLRRRRSSSEPLNQTAQDAV